MKPKTYWNSEDTLNYDSSKNKTKLSSHLTMIEVHQLHNTISVKPSTANTRILKCSKASTLLHEGSLTLAMGKCLWFSVKIKVCQLSLSSP